ARYGIAADALAAVCPFLILSDVLLVSECVFTAIVLAALACVLAYRRRGERSGVRWLIAAGVLTGLATLTRSNGLLLLIPFALGVWPGRAQGLRHALVPLAVLVVATVVVVVPWTIRNESALHTCVPVSTQDG